MRQNAALFPEARSTLAVITAFSMVINVLGLTGAIYMLQVYDRVLSSFSLPTLVVLSAIAAVLFATQGIIIALRGVLTARLADRPSFTMRPGPSRKPRGTPAKGRQGRNHVPRTRGHPLRISR